MERLDPIPNPNERMADIGGQDRRHERLSVGEGTLPPASGQTQTRTFARPSPLPNCRHSFISARTIFDA